MLGNTLFRPWFGTALLLVCVACSRSGSKPPESASRVEQTRGSTVYSDSITATVETVDREKRVLTLRMPDGGSLSLGVGENVDMDQIQPGDRVNATYEGTLAFALQEPGKSLPTETQASTERLPEGVQYGRQVSTTVQIVSVDPEGKFATFRNQAGEVRTVEVVNPANRDKVASLRPGDNVGVSYTEKLAIQLEK